MTEVASVFGKHKSEYTPHVDTGDCIVIVNAAKVAVTGNKYNDKCITTIQDMLKT